MRHIGPGRIRRKLAVMLARELHSDDFRVRTDPDRLRPTTGYWRTNYQADCMPWDGHIDVQIGKSTEWVSFAIGSWATMTDCLKGFTFSIHHGQIELHADHEKQRSMPPRATK